MVMMLTCEERVARFHWASMNKQQPCFCKSVIDVDVLRLNASPETITAIFGIRQPQSIQICNQSTQELVPLSRGKSENSDSVCWQVEPKRDCEVRVTDVDVGTDEEEPVVPINTMFPLFPGDSDDEKSERIEKLSNNFCKKLWEDEATPAVLREAFFSLFSTCKIQAFRQHDWFHETFDGPSVTDDCEREKHLLPKVMAKHTSSRMTKDKAVAWLQIMNRSLEEEFPNEDTLRSALGLHWQVQIDWMVLLLKNE